jgi:hypothetical protein
MADEIPLPPPPRVLAVFAAIRHVMEDMAKAGVGKLKTNSQQNFKYRGVDDVMDALAPSLARHGLIIVPHVNDRLVAERESRAGGTLFHTLLRIDYDFIGVSDGSVLHVGPIYGEAMDSGDKATNKAMATAYKYVCVQTFCIPVTGDDPDETTHQIADAREPVTPSRAEPKPPVGASVAAPAASVPASHPREVPVGADGKPRILRSGGNFGYGKKFATTPWEMMTVRDLEWFRNAERTPESVREKIDIELAWRAYDNAVFESARDADRAAAAAVPFDDHIP